MNVRDLTTAAVFSSVFIILSLIFIGLGLGYLGYIDFVVPVFTGILVLKCNIRYSVLASITSLLLIVFLIGDISAAIMMTQSMILGIVIGVAIKKGKGIYDDIFFCSMIACLIVIIFDINFSFLTGYSVLKECSQYLEYIPNDLEYIKDYIFYITISVLPVGTIILCYVIMLILGKKLNVLNEIGLIKAKIIFGYKKYSSLITCSQSTIFIGICLIIVFAILNNISLIKDYSYIKIICNCELCISIYFILQDSLSLINKFIFFKTKSRFKVFTVYIFMLLLLFKIFKVMTVFIVVISLLLNNKYEMKNRAEIILSKVVDTSI